LLDLLAVIHHRLQLSLCDRFWSIISKLKSSFTITFFLGVLLCGRLAFVFLLIIGISIHGFKFSLSSLLLLAMDIRAEPSLLAALGCLW
jgi:hypothetical protein